MADDTWIKKDTSVGRFEEAKSHGGDFDRAPREYRSPPASNLRKQISARERGQLDEVRRVYQRRFGKWTREGEPEPRYPGLPMFLWGVTAGIVLGACLVGLMNSLHL